MHVIGIDEAGRGALAGPVVVAAVAIPAGFKYHIKGLPPLKDSKQLSSAQRELWYRYIKGAKGVFYATSRVYQKNIDKHNITMSANIAASGAAERIASLVGKRLERFKILIDGGLYLGARDHQSVRASTIIRGDQRIVAIKLASIVAKVTRDKYMQKLAERYPQYEFAIHKGYGTKAHFRALRRYGITEVHRLTYLTGYPKLKPKRN